MLASPVYYRNRFAALVIRLMAQKRVSYTEICLTDSDILYFKQDEVRNMQRIRWSDKNCNVCEERLNSWDIRISKVLCYGLPVCEKCIAKEYDMDVEALRSRMEHYFGMRPCMGV